MMNIGIVNDMPLAVEALRRAILLRPEWRVCWVAGNGEEAVAMCAWQTPNLILMDLVMPGVDGVVATRRISPARTGSWPAAAPVIELTSSARVQPLSM